MLNDPPPDKGRKLHPLERPPQPRPGIDAERQGSDGDSEGGVETGEGQPRRMVTLHIPVVPPTITYALIAINAAIFVAAVGLFNPAQQNGLYEWGANNRLLVLEFGEYHRLFTAMFLHSLSFPAHIAFNMLALYSIGSTVERFFGHVRFALIYFLGGLAGSVMSVMFAPDYVYSVGASGAVFAIVGAEIVYLYRHRKLLGPMGRAQLRQLLVLAAINLAAGFASSLNTQGVSIDNWGHLGGLIGGLIVAWTIGPVFLVRRHPARPESLVTDDINPLERRVQPLLLYVSALLALLIAATLLARG